MPIAIRGKRDRYLDEIAQALAEYQAGHNSAEIMLFRANSASIDIRIIDPDFKGLNRADRHDLIWNLLEKVNEDTLTHVTVVLLLTPSETAESLGNFAFERSIKSKSPSLISREENCS